jgi:hypothetical protein
VFPKNSYAVFPEFRWLSFVGITAGRPFETFYDGSRVGILETGPMNVLSFSSAKDKVRECEKGKVESPR